MILLFVNAAAQILHLSSNGLTGSIAAQTPSLAGNLTNLDLSHNQLTGLIPDWLQALAFTNLDLSFNRLKGTYSGPMATSAALALNNNRLSGFIPAAFLTVTDINVMEVCNLIYEHQCGGYISTHLFVESQANLVTVCVLLLCFLFFV